MANDPRHKHPVLVVVIAVLAAVVGVACSGGDDPLTVGEVYDRMLAGMTEEGAVLYSTMTFEVIDPDGAAQSSGEREFWIDIHQDVSRTEFADTPGVLLYVQGDVYAVSGSAAVRDPPGSSMGTCAGSDREILFLYLGCEQYVGFTEEALDPRVEEGVSFEGRDAIGIRFSLYTTEEGETVESVLYVDPKTFLPIASATSTLDDAETGTFLRYVHQFLPRDELPDDWFEHGLDD